MVTSLKGVEFCICIITVLNSEIIRKYKIINQLYMIKCVLCDKKVPLKLKGNFYRTEVKLAMLYGTESWAVKSQHKNQVSVAEMGMLRWISGKTRHYRIRNDTIRERKWG
jgi:hypothetical protein